MQDGTGDINSALILFSGAALIILVGFSAFLSSSEIAMTSMEKIRLGVLVREHPRKAKGASSID